MSSMTRWAVDDEAGFLAFYDATARDAYRYASRLTGGDAARAEELVQEAFFELLRHARRGAAAEVGPGWVMVAIRHRFLDQVRSAQREERRLRLVWSRPDDEPPPDDPLRGVQLSDRERAALVLRYVDDLPVADVAAALGTSVRAAESLLARARARVRSEVRDA
jgi:RNA polymerase sigma-70 factor (ECF subfamily)